MITKLCYFIMLAHLKFILNLLPMKEHVTFVFPFVVDQVTEKYKELELKFSEAQHSSQQTRNMLMARFASQQSKHQEEVCLNFISCKFILSYLLLHFRVTVLFLD